MLNPWLEIFLVITGVYLIEYYITHKIWSKERIEQFLLNPITATISSAYLIAIISKGLFTDLFTYSSETPVVDLPENSFFVLAIIYACLLAVPLLSAVNYHYEKSRKKPPSKARHLLLKSFAQGGAQIILLVNFAYTILLLAKYIFPLYSILPL